MTGKAQPLELSQKIDKIIGDKIHSGGAYWSQQDFAFKRLVSDCERVAKAGDVATASFLLAKLFALAGDKDRSLYWVNNLASNGYKAVATKARYTILMLLGYPSEGLSDFEEAIANNGGDVSFFLGSAISHGWFERALKHMARCQKDKLVHKGLACFALAPLGAEIFKERGVTEEMVAKVLDQMYGELHKERTIWNGQVPLISFHDVGTKHSYVLMRFPIDVEASRAAELSWSLTERVVENGFDFPGLVVSFASGGQTTGQDVEELETA